MRFTQPTLNLNDSGVILVRSRCVKDKIGVWLLACEAWVTALIWLSSES